MHEAELKPFSPLICPLGHINTIKEQGYFFLTPFISYKKIFYLTGHQLYMLCCIRVIFRSISSVEISWLVLSGSFSNHPFTKIPPRTSISIWINYYLKNLQGIYSGSLKEIHTQLWGRVFFNSLLLCLVLFSEII